MGCSKLKEYNQSIYLLLVNKYESKVEALPRCEHLCCILWRGYLSHLSFDCCKKNKHFIHVAAIFYIIMIKKSIHATRKKSVPANNFDLMFIQNVYSMTTQAKGLNLSIDFNKLFNINVHNFPPTKYSFACSSKLKFKSKFPQKFSK